MPELDKLGMIQTSGYLEEVRDAKMVLCSDFSWDHDLDDYEEEKGYMQTVSYSVNHMGKWCLS